VPRVAIDSGSFIVRTGVSARPALQDANDRHGWAVANASGATSLRLAAIDASLPKRSHDVWYALVAEMETNFAATKGYPTFRARRTDIEQRTGLNGWTVDRTIQRLLGKVVGCYMLTETEHGERWSQTSNRYDGTSRSSKYRFIRIDVQDAVTVSSTPCATTPPVRLRASTEHVSQGWTASPFAPFKAVVGLIDVETPSCGQCQSDVVLSPSADTQPAPQNTPTSASRSTSQSPEEDVATEDAVRWNQAAYDAGLPARRAALRARLLAEAAEREAQFVPFDWSSGGNSNIEQAPGFHVILHDGAPFAIGGPMNSAHTSVPAVRLWLMPHDDNGDDCASNANRCGAPMPHTHHDDGIVFAGFDEQVDVLPDDVNGYGAVRPVISV
jgi:hypothetical protein